MTLGIRKPITVMYVMTSVLAFNLQTIWQVETLLDDQL
jgi:hypothetical protein